jgi:hypothetical protein
MTNNFLKVDMDGSGSLYSMQTIANFTGQSGFSGLTLLDMYNRGDLLIG